MLYEPDGILSGEDISPRVQYLISQLSEPSAERCIQAAQQLRKIGPSAAAAIPRLIELLDDSRTDANSESVGSAASFALASMGKEAVLACVCVYMKGRSPEHIEMLELTVSRFQDQESIETLIRLLKDPSPTNRFHAVAVVNRSTDPRLAPALIDALHDTDDGVRRVAARYFETHRDERVVQPLIEAVSDDCESVRVRAICALGQQRDQRALPALHEILMDPKKCDNDRIEAAKAIGNIGSADSFKTLVGFVHNRNDAPRVRYGAIEGLGNLGDHRAWEPLIQILQDRREGDDERVCAVYAITKIDREAAIPAMTSVALDGSERPYVRFWMAVKLVEATDGRLANVQVVEALTCYRFETRGLAIDPTREAAFDAFEALSKNGGGAQVRSAAKDELSILEKRDPRKVESKVQTKSSADSELLKLVRKKKFWRIASCSYYVLVVASWMFWYRRAASAHRRTVRPVYILLGLIAAGIPLAILGM